MNGPRITAGLRGAFWDPSKLPSDMRTSVHALQTVDGAVTTGVLYAQGNERTVVCIMHPREFVPQHYLVPEILGGGAAVWVQAPRTIGSDLRLEHENSVLEVSAGCEFLRASGFERIVLLGNSGGASMYALYNQQSLKDPAARIARTPAGRPVQLNVAALPEIDGMVFVSAHPGQGALLSTCIDGSLIDESDPFSVDETLSPFANGNGFGDPPTSARYSDSFLQRYRVAQQARVARIDALARADVERRAHHRNRFKRSPNAVDASQASFASVLQIWRTDADPRCYDLSLDPSERRYGSLWGSNPAQSNFGSIGFARLCTAESWMSSWSTTTSNASMALCGPSIEQPVLLVEYSADNSVFPGDVDAIYASIGAVDKQRVRAHGDHHGHSLGPDYPDGRAVAGHAIREWLRTKFPTRSSQ
jgi:hypothetical protein